MQQEQKSKRQLLQQRLDRIKKNSQILINKMDNQINSIQQVKKDLNEKSDKMNQCLNKLQQIITSSAQDMIMVFKPLYAVGKQGTIRKQPSIELVTNKIIQSKSICVLTGAGVSKNVGIPTFRGSNGLYSKKFTFKSNRNDSNQNIEMNPQEFLTMSTFNKHPQQIWKWCGQLNQLVSSKSPGIEHELIHELCLQLKRANIKTCLVTTNIDSLHHKMLNSTDPQYPLFQIHGNFCKYVCKACNSQQNLAQQYSSFQCKFCKCTILRPFVMFFDQKYDNTFDPSNLRNQQFDLTIVIGTSLQTGLSTKIIVNSKIVIQINPQCTLKNGQVYQFEQNCDKVLQKLVAQLKIKRMLQNK